MAYRTWMFVKKELAQLLQMKVVIVMVIFGPLLEMSLIAWSTSAPIDDLPTAVVNLDQGAAARQLLTTLYNTETFDFRYHPDSTDEAGALIESGKAIGALTIPPDYSQKLDTPLGEPARLSFILDGADPVAAQVALSSLEGAVADESQRAVSNWIAAESADLSLIQPQLRVRFNEELKKSVYTVPSELAIILFAIGLIIASISIARERELGTLEQLMVTPVQLFEVIIAKAVPAVILSYTSFILMMLVAIHGFKLPMRGSWSLLLGTSVIFLLVELSIGLMISASAKTQLQGMMVAMLWVMTETFFSGYGVPVETMPKALQTLAHIFPIYHYLIIFRAVLLKGVGMEVIWPQVLAGLIIGAVVIPLAVWFLGRQKWD